MVHGYVSIGQSSKEGAAQVLEADDWPSTRGQQDQQVLNRCVHAAVHVDAVKTRTSVCFRTEEVCQHHLDSSKSIGTQLYSSGIASTSVSDGNKVTLKCRFEEI